MQISKKPLGTHIWYMFTTKQARDYYCPHSVKFLSTDILHNVQSLQKCVFPVSTGP